jgi:hypothetical protein
VIVLSGGICFAMSEGHLPHPRVCINQRVNGLPALTFEVSGEYILYGIK